jgi:hypothetical protein
MNKVLLDLLKQSTVTKYRGMGEIDELDQKKFAELIVREAASLVASAQITKDGHTWRSADYVVLEHFGVDK